MTITEISAEEYQAMLRGRRRKGLPNITGVKENPVNSGIITATKYSGAAVLEAPRAMTQEVSAPMCSKNTVSPIPYGYCHCGCGQRTKIENYNRTARGGVAIGEPRRFVSGHKGSNNRQAVQCANCGHELLRPKNRLVRSSQHFCGNNCREEFIRSHPKPDDSFDRFMSKAIVVVSGCWEWSGYVAPEGYGRFAPTRSKVLLAHRYSYTHFYGDIPEGMFIDHLCRNRRCVNPDHLEAVTPKENALRGESPLIKINRAQACARGHSYAQHSFYRDGRRIYCRTCKIENEQRGRHGQTGNV